MNQTIWIEVYSNRRITQEARLLTFIVYQYLTDNSWLVGDNVKCVNIIYRSRYIQICTNYNYLPTSIISQRHYIKNKCQEHFFFVFCLNFSMSLVTASHKNKIWRVTYLICLHLTNHKSIPPLGTIWSPLSPLNCLLDTKLR